MAEESIGSLVTPECIGSDTRRISKKSAPNPISPSNWRNALARHRRASPGSYHAGHHSLRNSAENSGSASSNQNVVSRYLRASTGSCHDFCKHGSGHSFEEKERKPLPKRIPKPLANALSSSVQIPVSDGQLKEKVLNHRPSIDKKSHSVDQNLAPDTKSLSAKPRTSLDKDKAMNPNPSEDTKNHTFNIPLPNLKSFQKAKAASKTNSLKANDSSGNKTLLSECKPSSAKKFPLADPPEIVKSVIFPSVVVEVPIKPVTSTDEKVSKAERKTTSVSQQRSSLVKLKPVRVKPSSSFDSSDVLHGKGRRNSIAIIGKNLTTSEAPSKKSSPDPAATVYPKLRDNKTTRIISGKTGNFKLSSHLKDQNRIRRVKIEESSDDNVPEKTLHVMETETEHNVSESISKAHAILSLPSASLAESLSRANSSSSSSSSQEEEKAKTEQSDKGADEVIFAEIEESGSGADEVIISDNNDTQEIVQIPLLKENQNKALRKIALVVPEDKCLSPVKLKFRTGKVVDIQSENNSPRILKFRRASALGVEDSKGNSSRALKKATKNDDRTDAAASSENVVLKHQNVHGKKNDQGLLNRVIEETASKLVEGRRSKVKALVGAFETVISLQESNPSSQVIS